MVDVRKRGERDAEESDNSVRLSSSAFGCGGTKIGEKLFFKIAFSDGLSTEKRIPRVVHGRQLIRVFFSSQAARDSSAGCSFF
jgi:hypothetical protein